MQSETFAKMVRRLLDDRRMSLSELAEETELAASLVSKLLTDTEESRRDPKIEHIFAIARALKVTPRELVTGTSAEETLGAWVPREELDSESKARIAAQAQIGTLETKLAGATAELSATKAELNTFSTKLSELERASQREISRLRVANQTADAERAAALVQRDHAVQVATATQEAFAKAKSQLLQAHRDLAAAQGSKNAAWVIAAIAGLGGVALGSMRGEDDEDDDS